MEQVIGRTLLVSYNLEEHQLAIVICNALRESSEINGARGSSI